MITCNFQTRNEDAPKAAYKETHETALARETYRRLETIKPSTSDLQFACSVEKRVHGIATIQQHSALLN